MSIESELSCERSTDGLRGCILGNDILLLRPGEDVHAAEHMSLSGHSKQVRSVSFSPDGTLLASGSEDNTLKLWNVRSGECVKTLSGHGNIVYSVSFSPDASCIWFTR
jgi:WD40 repeat protein